MPARPGRSWLFVPGDRERFLEKAATSAADCVFLDLEDAVLPAAKAAARRLVADALAAPFGPRRYVRVNPSSSPWHEDDLRAVVPGAPEGVCLPKCGRPEDVVALAGRLDELESAAGLEPGSTRIVAAIESPGAVLASAAIAAAHPRVAALALGAEDLALELGLGSARGAGASELVFARSMVVYGAGAAGVASIDGVFPDLEDADGLARDALAARRLGFSAKSTISPRQVEVVNRVFSPGPDEVAWARRVVASWHEAGGRGDGSAAAGGELVDRPVVLRAMRLLELADAEPSGEEQ
jgi:citrate lyase subunit beta/citryl-CoA lyase